MRPNAPKYWIQSTIIISRGKLQFIVKWNSFSTELGVIVCSEEGNGRWKIHLERDGKKRIPFSYNNFVLFISDFHKLLLDFFHLLIFIVFCSLVFGRLLFIFFCSCSDITMLRNLLNFSIYVGCSHRFKYCEKHDIEFFVLLFFFLYHRVFCVVVNTRERPT